MPGVYAAAISVQQLVLPLEGRFGRARRRRTQPCSADRRPRCSAGALLALMLVRALVTVVLPSGRKRAATPSTAAGADADCLLAPSQ